MQVGQLISVSSFYAELQLVEFFIVCFDILHK